MVAWTTAAASTNVSAAFLLVSLVYWGVLIVMTSTQHRIRNLMGALIVVVLTTTVLVPSATAADDISVIGTANSFGRPFSMVLDSADNPVIAFYDTNGKDLYVVRCADPACATSTTQIVDSTGDVGQDPSLVLDSVGNPVVAYHDGGNDDLKLLHCDDPNCTPAGNSITRPDSAGITGQEPSLKLDAAGNPVIAYGDSSADTLNILHCNDPNCTPAGNSIEAPVTGLPAHVDPSLVLDAAGNPVVAYYDLSPSETHLELLHCNDPNCAPGGDTSFVIDDRQFAGEEASLALDSAGNPVVVYRVTWIYNNLRFIHCDDPNCAPGGDPIQILAGDLLNATGYFPSVVLAPNGNPIITYMSDESPLALNVMYCHDVDCLSKSVGKPNAVTGRSINASAIALDSRGLPVVSFISSSAGVRRLDLVRCDDLNCGLPPTAVADAGYETYNVAPLTVAAPGVLANDVDDDSLTLTATVASQPANGTVVVNADGSFTYTPTAGYVGTDTFSYRANDATDSSSPVTVTINVEAPVYCGGQLVTIDLRKPNAGSPTSGPDVIFGTPGDDLINAGQGDDWICGEGGNDTINAGDGKDFAFGGPGNDALTGGDGNDRLRGQEGVDTIVGNDGNDFLYGGIDDDIINGNDGNDTIGGFGGADTIDGGDGNDKIFGGFGPDTIDGGRGDDQIRGLIGNDTIRGEDGNDSLYGDNGQDNLSGGSGNDLLSGGNSLDALSGGSGDDSLRGGKGSDSLDGGPGSDTCTGNTGDDTASTTCENIFGVP